MYTQKKQNHFTQKEIAAALQEWTRAAVSLIDIRHRLISPDNALQDYRLPASAFLYTSGGKAEVQLRNAAYKAERFGLFHAGRGTVLSIQPKGGWLEYYLVLYKAEEIVKSRRVQEGSAGNSNPFQQQYGFTPENPIFFSVLFQRMFEAWKQAAPLNKFYEKTAFYQMVYEIYKEMETQDGHILTPDAALMAKRYMETHYSESISVQKLADSLGLSVSHFRRMFKDTVGMSPQEYLIACRIKAAKTFLKKGGYSLREIALALGYYDEFHFSTAYKKATGISPQAQKAIFQQKESGYYMGNGKVFPYNEESQVSYGKPKERGEISMFRKIQSKAVVAAVLSLMLLMSACGTGTGSGSSTEPASASSVSSQVLEVSESPETEETRTVSTVMGDVEVPVNPRRVIVQYLMGDLVALDIIPIGITEVHKGAAFEELLTDAMNLSQWEFEPEEVMALEPDLIILASDTQYEDMSKIAPTILVPYGTMTREERMGFLGEVFGRAEGAQAALAEYNTAVSEGKAKLAQAGLGNVTISAMQVTEEQISVVGNKHSLGRILYDELGLKAPRAVQEEIIDAGEYWGGSSMEVLADYCGEYVFHMGDVSEDIAENAVWQSIPAVTENKVFIMDTAFTYYSDISSSIAMINNVVDQLLNVQK